MPDNTDDRCKLPKFKQGETDNLKQLISSDEI